MKLIKVLLLALCLSTLVPQLALAQESTSKGLIRHRNAIRNSYIVVFKDSVPQGRVEAFANQLTREHGGRIGFIYQHALRGFSVELNEGQAIALSRNPQVEYVEEDVLVEGADVQSSPPWPLDRLDQRNLPLNNSYTYANSGTGVNVYVIDGGIRLTHQEFNGRAVYAYDNVGDGRNGVDCNGHGTHVAGIIGGATYGVAKGVKLHAVRVLNCSNQALASKIIAGIDWVTANHLKPAVANLSFATSANANDALDLAVRNSIAAGIPYVVAAGNGNRDAGLQSPARVREAITVAAIDQNDNRATFSNFGASVDVFAPGVEIYSAHSLDDASKFMRSGTSSAAPFVTGLVARYLATRPGDQPEAVSQAIINASTPDVVINPGEGTPNLLACADNTLSISDDFNDNVRDRAKWNAPTALDFNVVEQNGRLEITPAATAASYEGYKSAIPLDLTNARVSVEASIPGNIPYYFGSNFMLSHSASNNLTFSISYGNLKMQQQVGGVQSYTEIPYNALEQRFWRIRHNRADDTIRWEVSPDGVTWTALRSAPRPFSITNLQTILTAGKPAAERTATAIFDNVWHEVNPIPSVVMIDNFDNNVLNPAMWTVLDNTSPSTITEQNGRIEVNATYNANGLNLTESFDFRNKTVQVEVGGRVEEATYFRLYDASYNYFEFRLQWHNALYCNYMPNPSYNNPSWNWNAASMRFWRFRHEGDANTVSFDMSGDGITWTTYRTVTATFDLHSVRVMMSSRVPTNPLHRYGGEAYYAYFDNFRVESYGQPFSQSDDFNDNARDVKKWSVPETTDFNIAEQNGRLEITPGASAGRAGYTSVAPIDLTDARASVEVLLTAPPIEGFGTYFELADKSGNNLVFGIDGSNLSMQHKTIPAPTTPPVGDVVWVDDAVPAGSILGEESEPWNWVNSNPSSFSGTAAHQSNHSNSVHQHYFYDATSTLTVNPGDKLVAYVYLDPAYMPSEIMLQWNDGIWDHRAYWGANNISWGVDGTNSRRHMGALPPGGRWTRLEVPAALVGLEGSTLNGMAFTLHGGRATWDYAGKSDLTTPPPIQAGDVIWIEDAVPSGGALAGDEDWNWVNSNPPPVSGASAHQSKIQVGAHQHYFQNATSTLAINAGDKLITYVYLDPVNTPRELMLQWYDGSWEHRAYWGANQIPWGADGTNSRRYMGALPPAGQWVRLEVPAALVGLEGSTLNGMAFTLCDGRATWDVAGKSTGSTAPTPTPTATPTSTSTAGGTSRVLIPYNAVQHRRWRIRHNRAADTVVWETSPDGLNWTAQHTVPRPFPLADLQLLLYAGKNAATTSAMTVAFDNLRIERNGVGLAH